MGLRRQRMRNLLSHMRKAESHIWIVNPYWVPGPLTIKTLIDAAQRGIDVRLCLPQTSDIFFYRWISEIMLAPLIPYGVKIFEYKGGFLHAKVVAIDEWAKVGSTNFNYRSRYHDLEADLILSKTINIKKLTKELLDIFKRSILVTAIELESRSRFQKITARFFLLFRKWI